MDDFYDVRGPKAPKHGKLTRCKDCERQRVLDQRERGIVAARNTRRRKLIKKQLEAADRRVKELSPNRRVVYIVNDDIRIRLQEWVDILLANNEGEMLRVAAVCGVPDRTLRAILHGERRSVESRTLDAVATAAGRQQEFADLYPEPGFDGWSRFSRYCIGCGTHTHPHYAKDRCRRCYHYWRRNGREREEGIMLAGVPVYWARHLRLMACRVCGDNDSKHRCYGICMRCEGRARRWAHRRGIHLVGEESLLEAAARTLPAHRKDRKKLLVVGD